MADLGGFDIVFHLRQDVLGDILLRVVNVSLLGQGMTVGQVKRQLTLPPPPATAQAGIWWEQPALSVGQNGGLRLAVPVRGGVRDTAQQRMLSVGGSLGMSRPIELAAAPDGMPFVRLAAPDLASLDVEDLRLSYADPHTPSVLAPIWISRVRARCCCRSRWPTCYSLWRGCRSATPLARCPSALSCPALIRLRPSRSQDLGPRCALPPTPL